MKRENYTELKVFKDTNTFSLDDVNTNTIKIDQDGAIINEEKENPYWYSDNAYFSLICMVSFLPLVYLVASISVYNKLYGEYLYGYYIFFYGNVSCFFYPFFTFIARKMHFINQGKLLIFNGIVWVYIFGFIGINFPHSKVAYYFFMYGILISKTIAYGTLGVVFESFKFYPRKILPFYYSGFPLLCLLLSITLLPLSFFEVSSNTQIVILMAICTGVFVYSYILHNQISNSPYYYEKMSYSQQFADETSIAEIYQEGKKVSGHLIMLVLIVTCYSVLFPSMIAEFTPSFVNAATWTNTLSLSSFLITISAYFFSFERLESDRVQNSLNSILILYTIYQSLVFTLQIDPPQVWKDNQWLICLIFGAMGIGFQQAFYIKYAVKITVNSTERRAVNIVMNGGMFLGFLIGGAISSQLAEVRKYRLGK